jgi:Fur family zinc uptake transcriptional regulator
MEAAMTEHATLSAATKRLLACADTVCARNGAHLTKLRRTVLGLVIDSDRPAGAYDLQQRLNATQGRTAPPTVYRALEFLIAEGLVHKIERLSAYVACTHHLRHQHDHPAHAQSVQFLICTGCGRATELEDDAMRDALHDAAGRAGFRLNTATVEADGVCRNCMS